jgi:hypothetical protein
MEQETLVNVAVLSGLVGFGVFCISYTATVWWKRNAVAGRKGRLRRWAAVTVTVGALIILAVIAHRELASREGVLKAERLMTVRAREDFMLQRIYQGEQVEAGQILVQFTSPKRKSEIEALQVELTRQEAERRVLDYKPLEADPELVRRHQDAVADVRQLRTTVNQLLPACHEADRVLLTERLRRLEKLMSLHTDQDETKRMKEETSAEHDLAAKNREWVRSLSRNQAVGSAELAEANTQFDLTKTKVARYGERTGNLAKEQAKLEENVAALQKSSSEQVGALERELERARGQLAEAEESCEQIDRDLATDRKRAEQLRTQEIAEVVSAIARDRATLAGLQADLEVKAPFAGRVVYRDPAPNTVGKEGPLLAVAPGEGFRVRLRVPKSEVALLSRAGEVRLELADPLVEKQFSGWFASAEVLPHELWHSVVEMDCRPPAAILQKLAADKTVRVRLRWRPSLLGSYVFLSGLAILVAGAVTWGAAGAIVGEEPIADEATTPAKDAPVDGAEHALPTSRPGLANIAAMELGEAAPVLRMLGGQLRQAIDEDEVDESLLAAVEWSLDRHHTRAVQSLREGIEVDEWFVQRAQRLVEDLERSAKDGNGSGEGSRRRLRRVNRILRAVAPEALAYQDGSARKKTKDVPTKLR